MLSKNINTNGINLHYIETETNGPTIILMHGLTANAHAFDGLLKEGLDKNFRVISVDLRGRGQSEKPVVGYTMKDHAQDILGLMDSLSIEKCILGGHSFGALLTIYMAIHHPERIEKLLLLDAAARLHPQTKEMLVPALSRIGQTYPSFEAYLEKVKSGAYMTYWEDTMLSYYKADVIFNEDGTVTQRSTPENMTEAILKGSFGEPWLEYIKSVEHNSLLLNGTMNYALDAPLLPKEFALETVEMMKSCQYQEVWGNHQTMLYGQGAKDIVAAIDKFLNV